MAKVKIDLDTKKYRPISNDDIKEGKRYATRRGRASSAVVQKLNKAIDSSTKKLVRTGYKYNISGENFEWNAVDSMYNEVTDIMEELYEECLGLIYDYSVPEEVDDDRRDELVAFLILLGRKNRSMEETLHEYLWRYLYDVEAFVASTKIAKLSSMKAMSRIVSNIRSVYNDALVKSAMKVNGIKAMYLANQGKHTDRFTGEPTPGVPINGSAAVANLGNTLVNLVWWRNESLNMMGLGNVVGYYQLRGSSYPCTICDEEVGFHPVKLTVQWYDAPYPHSHCMCYRIPVYSNDKMDEL